MKKVILSLILVSLIFLGCSTENNYLTEEEQFFKDFSVAVEEIYQIVGKKFFFSGDGINLICTCCQLYIPGNLLVGNNEQPGYCTDYAIEFIYYWNIVYRYDLRFGKAYVGRANDAGNFTIIDNRLSSPHNSPRNLGTGNNFQNNRSGSGNNNGTGSYRSYFRDITNTRIFYSSSSIVHYTRNMKLHWWPIINYNDNWYSVDPTFADSNFAAVWAPHTNHPPQKLDINVKIK